MSEGAGCAVGEGAVDLERRRLSRPTARPPARFGHVLALLLALWACNGETCGGATHLAELRALHGEVERDLAARAGQFHAARGGDRFAVGDGLRTGPSGNATLALLPEGMAVVEPNTLLRFLDRDPRGGEQRVSVQQGQLEVSSGKLELDVHTPRGFARLEQGARVRIVASRDHALLLDVLVGRVALDQDGQSRALVAGEQVSLSAAPGADDDGAVAREDDGGEADASSVDEGDASAPEVQALDARERPLELTLPALENATVHARALPLRVRLATVPACPVAPQLDVDGRAQPADGAHGYPFVLSSLGKHRVRVRCQRRTLAVSVLRVAPESSAELPRRAQKVEVEPDGRRYTVRYQNVVPVVSVTWPGAQPASSYTLHLRQGKRERSLGGEQPRHEFASGTLSEGRYEFWFTGAGGQRSAVSMLRIELDESARALTLREPADGSAAEARVPVSGVALLRSRVSANGVPLPLDDHGRFHAELPLARGKIVLVRAEHPAVGVHYYLRRLR